MEPSTLHPTDERGATSVEYALLLAMIAAVIVGAVALLGGGTNGLFAVVCNPPSPFTC